MCKKTKISYMGSDLNAEGEKHFLNDYIIYITDYGLA